MSQEEKFKICYDLKDDSPATEKQKTNIDSLKVKLQHLQYQKEQLKPKLYMVRM